MFVDAFARSACRLVERAECFPYAWLGTLSERIARLLVGTDKDIGKQKRGAGGRAGVASNKDKSDKRRSNRRWFLRQRRLHWLQECIFLSYVWAPPGIRPAESFLRIGELKICNFWRIAGMYWEIIQLAFISASLLTIAFLHTTAIKEEINRSNGIERVDREPLEILDRAKLRRDRGI